jgi:hypothetical protein
VYDDGHEWCFGCGYYKPPEHSLENVRQKQQKGDKQDVFDLNLSPYLSHDAYSWLKKYGISDEEIERFEVGYDKERELLCFPIKEEGRITGYICRNFGPSRRQRKYLFYGSRRLPPIIDSQESDKNIGVFVEDIISAIKVGRSYAALPVLSANIDAKALKWASDRFVWVGVWLDRDMHGKVSKLVLRGSWVGQAKWAGIYSPKDPKEYSTQEIKGWVNHAFGVERAQISPEIM